MSATICPNLREAGAPLDNNICERALKRAVLHRKNALFYRTLHGAEAGDLFMSLIHTCELAGPIRSITSPSRYTPGMPRKQAFPQTESRGVFGHPFRVGLYARVSIHDQQTLPLQIHAMREYAAKRGWSIVAQIKEVGSGASQRELRTTLIAAARRREVDVVLVWRLDRWGRSVADLVSTLQELQHLDVGFVSLTEALDLTTPAGRAMAALLAVFAEFEREILRKRVRAGLSHARLNGKRLGRPPSAAHQGDQARKLCRDRLSKSEIARQLSISRTSVRRILSPKKS